MLRSRFADLWRWCRQQDPSRAETQLSLTQLATDIGKDWKQSGYYDAAEPYMEEQWQHIIWPYIQDCDFSCVIDLAVGHGRNTDKLRRLAGTIYAIDINEENIKFCQQRFAGDKKVHLLLNNGFTFTGVTDATVTLVYCFDAMVHFDSDVVRSYLRESARVLKPGGYGFFHHSNYDKNPSGNPHDNPGWRNFMSQNLFIHYCSKEGLDVVRSQIVDWSSPEMDCLTLFHKSL